MGIASCDAQLEFDDWRLHQQFAQVKGRTSRNNRLSLAPRFGRPKIFWMTDPPSPKPPKLLDRMREALRVRHYSYRTEQAYLD